jgi:hypothetical protein
MYVIPNLIIVPVVNINWLSLHFSNVSGDLGLPVHGVHDRDQNSSTKSWLTAEEEAAGWDMVDHVYRLTEQHRTGRMTYSDVRTC